MMCVSCELCEECVACSVMCSFLSVKKSERVWPLRGEGGEGGGRRLLSV